MRRYVNGTRIEVMWPISRENLAGGDRGIIRGSEYTPDEGGSYRVYNVEFEDGRIIGLTAQDMKPAPDPFAGQQFALFGECA